MNIKAKTSLHSGLMGWTGLGLGLFFVAAMINLWAGGATVAEAEEDRPTLQASLQAADL